MKAYEGARLVKIVSQKAGNHPGFPNETPETLSSLFLRAFLLMLFVVILQQYWQQNGIVQSNLTKDLNLRDNPIKNLLLYNQLFKMKIHFHKYQGTGNDFVILDNRTGRYDQISQTQVKELCDRRFGIGADGLMMLNTKDGYDFEMKYFNADGGESSMCGNGGRCLVKFAADMGIYKDNYHFIASDGPHEAEIDADGTVSLKMKDVIDVTKYGSDFTLDTGSPHYIKFVNDVMNYDVYKKGNAIRNSDSFSGKGINVNFVQQKSDFEIIVRTYERGVEDETWSCGTGVTAAALVCYHNETGYNDVTVLTKGGRLTVEYDRQHNGQYSNIFLCGPAAKVFEGDIEI